MKLVTKVILAICLIVCVFISCETEPVHYNITFETNGGTEIESLMVSQNSRAVAPSTPIKAGVTFDGWYLDENFEYPFNFRLYKIYEDITLYAKWTTNYTVTFLSEKTSSLEVEVQEGRSVSKPTNPVTEEYQFLDWYKDAEFKFLYDFTEKVDGNLNLYAKWSKLFKVNFDAGIEIYSPAQVYVGEGKRLEKPTTPPEKPYNEFLGWCIDSDKKVMYNFNEAVNKNFILYAKWAPINYSITYNLNSGTINGNNPSTYTLNDTITFLEPTRDGFLFNGWYNNSSFTGDEVEGINSGSHGSKTFHAKWAPINYEITYNLNNGTNNSSNPLRYNTTDTIVLQDPTKTGYTFTGWYNQSNNKVVSINSGTIGRISLEARWALTSYSIDYNLYGGTTEGSNPSTYTVEDSVTFHSPTRDGYDFDGWYSNSSFSGISVGGISHSSTGNKTFHAKWTPVNYTIIYNSEGGTNNISNPIIYSVQDSITFLSPTRTGYTFIGWYNQANEKIATIKNGSIGDVSLKAKWDIIDYTIDYNLNSGTNDSNNPKEYTHSSDTITLEEPTRTGYTFGGWYNNSGFTGEAVEEITLGSTGNKMFHAKWTPINYNISYQLNDGTNDERNPSTYAIEESITLLDPTKPGYSFGGWFTKDNFELSSKVLTIGKGSTKDRTLYAKWEVVTYAIEYNLYNGTNNVGNVKTYTIASDDITLLDPTRTGYTFGGWFSDSNLIVGLKTQIINGSTGDKTLYAKWTPVNYDMTFDSNGAPDNHNNPSTYTIVDSFALLNPTRVGYSFTGWYNAADEKIVTIKNGTIGDLSLKAKWEVVSYAIEYNLYSGTNNVGNVTTYTIASDDITLLAPTRTGYTFDGWFTDSNFTPTKEVSEISSGSTGDKTLYAKWTPVNYDISYQLNDGTNDERNPSTYTIEESITLLDPTRTGYTFGGWFTNSEFGSGTKVSTIAKGSTDNKTLYAKWE
ncbi:MAG: hypothetical protein EOM67_10015, partial [Spirochaetia bacterium]|nr:hypothetical protein [Spirochaetia bacterium]